MTDLAVFKKESQVIGLDYDGTITSDPQAFYHFCKLFQGLGHKIYIVTMRYAEEPLNHVIRRKYKDVVEDVIYTGREAKKPFVEALGIKIDIWIDDNPQAVNLNAEQAFPVVFPKGQTS